MIGYYSDRHRKEYVEPPEEDPVKLDEYRTHKAAGTVPKKGIPYTKQSRVRDVYLFPGARWVSFGTKAYIREFERLNNLKEIPQ